MAGGFSAAGVTDRQRTGEQVFRDWELADESEFPLAEPGGLRALGLGFHLEVILLQEEPQRQWNF
jgi:hypothetical protein